MEAKYINYFEDSIREVDNEILNLITQDEALNRNYQLLISIPGIGPVVASDTIAYTEKFTKITDPRKYCAYIGLMSYEQSSGTIKGKPKRREVKHPAKRNLGAICANNIANDSHIRDIYERMQAQGKTKGATFNRIKCFLVKRMSAVVLRGTPFEYRDATPSL